MRTFIQFGHPGSSESPTVPDMDYLCWPTHPQAALELAVLNCELCLLHRALYDDNCLDSQTVSYNSHNNITNGLIIAAVISLAKADFPGTCRSRSYIQEIYLPWFINLPQKTQVTQAQTYCSHSFCGKTEYDRWLLSFWSFVYCGLFLRYDLCQPNSEVGLYRSPFTLCRGWFPFITRVCNHKAAWG